MTLFSLKQGQDLDNRVAHPHLEFPGVPPVKSLKDGVSIWYIIMNFSPAKGRLYFQTSRIFRTLSIGTTRKVVLHFRTTPVSR